MEKEVRAMLEKGEKVTLVAIDECVMRNCSNFKALIIGKEYLIDDYEGLKKFFKLKQPKDPNELPEKKTKKDKFLKLLKKYNWVVKIEKEQKLGSCADIYAENKCDLTNYFMIIDDGNVKNVLNEAVYHIYVNNFDFKIFEGVINSEKEFKNTMRTLGFEKKTKKERIEELENLYKKLEEKFETFCGEFRERVKSLEEEKTITICTDVNHRGDGVIEVTLDDIEKQNLEDAKSMVNDKHDLWKFFNNEHNLTLLDSEIDDIIHEVNEYQKLKQSENQAPEFWYIDIVEEKDSELLPTFKEWFYVNIGFIVRFHFRLLGYSGINSNKGFDFGDEEIEFYNSDKMQKITLNEWDSWFNK